MADAPELFLNCCQAVLVGDAHVLDDLRAAGFDCAVGTWSFTLPALHGFLSDQLGLAIDYQTFIRQLFASDINLRLRVQGAEIAIEDNRGKVNASRYCLRRLGIC